MAKSRKAASEVEETVDADEQQEPQLGAAAGGGKGGTKASKRRNEEPPPGKLNGSIWERGRGYGPGDEKEFAKLGLKTEILQSLANQKTAGGLPLIEGFGVEPDEDEEEAPELTGEGSPGRRNAGKSGKRVGAGNAESEDEEDEE